MKTEKISTPQMELALVQFLDPRTNLIVPNVSWGMGLHECDLLVITRAGYAWEIEIKVSKQDLVKDKEKRHKHYSHKIKFLYFAIPHYLLEHQEHIPSRAGIITVTPFRHTFICEKIRKPRQNSKYVFSSDEKYKVARLGALRIWGLKRKLL